MKALAPRVLALGLLAMMVAGAVFPTHQLDQVMLMANGYLWGSPIDGDFGGRPLLDVMVLAQPLLLLATTLACGWTLRFGRPLTLLGAGLFFQLLLVATGLHAYAIDGGSWRGLMATPLFDVLQGATVVVLVLSAALQRSDRSARATPHSPTDT
jgi:hypothetical protein